MARRPYLRSAALNWSAVQRAEPGVLDRLVADLGQPLELLLERQVAQRVELDRDLLARDSSMAAMVVVAMTLALAVFPARERRARADRGGRHRGARSRKQAAAIELLHEYSSRRELLMHGGTCQRSATGSSVLR